jgi:glutamyl-tRNA reductase
MENICVLGFNFKETEFSILEKLVLTTEEVVKFINKFKQYYCNLTLGIVVLSTCNRLEIYCSSPISRQEISNSIIAILVQMKQLDKTSLINNNYFLQAEHCVKHLFLVCSGLDSMIIGENFIVSQIKQAVFISKSTIDTNLNVIFNMALSISKKIRNLNLSFSDAWGSRIANIINTTTRHNNKSILFIGAGSMMPHIIQQCLASTSTKSSDCAICNRTYDHAEKIAKKMNIKNIDLNCIKNELQQYCIIVSCISDNENIFAKILENIQDKLLIDLSMPPIISQTCILNNQTFTIREIAQIINKENSIKKEVSNNTEVAYLIDQQLNEFIKWQKRRQEHI